MHRVVGGDSEVAPLSSPKHNHLPKYRPKSILCPSRHLLLFPFEHVHTHPECAVCGTFLGVCSVLPPGGEGRQVPNGRNANMRTPHDPAQRGRIVQKGERRRCSHRYPCFTMTTSRNRRARSRCRSPCGRNAHPRCCTAFFPWAVGAVEGCRSASQQERGRYLSPAKSDDRGAYSLRRAAIAQLLQNPRATPPSVCPCRIPRRWRRMGEIYLRVRAAFVQKTIRTSPPVMLSHLGTSRSPATVSSTRAAKVSIC